MTTGRITLTDFTPNDLDGVMSVYGDPAVVEHLSFGTPRTREQCEVLLQNWMLSAAANPRTEHCLASRSDTGELAGVVRIALDPHQPQAATFGFALAPAYWGQGLGIATVNAVQEYSFTRLELHRLWAARAPLNLASAKTLLRAGFVEEGRIRAHVFVNGAWRDSITYGALSSEWSA